MSEIVRATMRLMKLHQQQRLKIQALTTKVTAAARAEAAKIARTTGETSVADQEEVAIPDDELWPALILAARLAANLPPPEIQELLMRLPSELRDDLTDRLFSFEALLRLDDKSIQRVLAQVEARTLGIALIGCDDALMAVITRNMSARAAEMLSEDIDSYVVAGEISTIDVRLARESISHSIRLLYLDGEIGT